MSDLISREALRQAMYHEAMESDSDEQRWDSGCWIRYKMFEHILEQMPSVEPERKKGKWLCKPYGIIFKQKIWQCSVCGNTLDFEGVNAGRGDANYCPNCGARMDCSEEAKR